MPEVPSAHASAMVLGWLGSGPSAARPRTSDAPVSHERPTVAHFGACRAASKLAVRSGGPVPVTDSERLAERVLVPLVPLTLKLYEPTAVVPATETVRALVPEPLAGGVTEAGLKPQVAPAGRPEQARLTALAKPPVEVTVQVLEALPP